MCLSILLRCGAGCKERKKDNSTLHLDPIVEEKTDECFLGGSKLMMNMYSDVIIRRNSSSSSTETPIRNAVNNQPLVQGTGGSCCKQEVADEMMMTLEDFLARAGAVEEEDVKPIPLPGGCGGGGGIFNAAEESRSRILLLDKAAQQRQRRMIKNRESAARSRERKQAYQAELESLALKLEQQNETLLKLKKEQTRKRYKQLIDNIIPVTEKQRPTRYMLRRIRSMEW
ncbi:hypothetical protein E3N88_07641 [Mikania micrantha]|uniref:BZIP domain-containing protein n=1 Tax=Mikania micrantha TaxID=192012 RepID=A0A5N6PU52_9ASTR|nr:hypothetical protein E3N88_07641 [Mikania micrantha]